MPEKITQETLSKTESPDSPPEKSEERHQYGMFRNLVESVLALVIAVILFRTFLIDSYMISTGSMAPHLLGYHKQVTCPSCGFEFSIGVEFNSSSSRKIAAVQNDGETKTVVTHKSTFAACPNCGLKDISVDRLPRSQGDQILVNRYTFLTRIPRRWEVVVFNNPENANQPPYVKRVVGLPGETLSTKYGDIYADGQLVRKSSDEQHALRLLVYDHDFEPRDDPEWKSRWVPNVETSNWKKEGSGFRIDPSLPNSYENKIDWLVYRHWVRSGGSQVTEMPLPSKFPKSELENPSLFPLHYDPQTRNLFCRGAMTTKSRDHLVKMFDDVEFKREVEKLYEKSHIGTIGDAYAYNARVHRPDRNPVRDLMINFDVEFGSGDGRFLLQMSDGDKIATLQIVPSTRTVELLVSGHSVAVKSVTLTPGAFENPLNLEMSLFDRQVVVLINKQQIFSPYPFPQEIHELQLPKNPVRLASENLSLTVDSLKLYRDVYYTEKGPRSEYVLGPDELLMMGDNSPVSADSRVWNKPEVNRRMLLGKPFVVHLPSKPAEFSIGGRTVRYRVPDFARIRYIR